MLNETGVNPSTYKNHVLADYWSPNTAIHQFLSMITMIKLLRKERSI